MLADEELRALLRQAPVPPTQLAVDGLLHAGHRKVRQRRLTATGGVAALVVAVVAVLLGPAGLTGRQGTGPIVPAVTPTATASGSPADTARTCERRDLTAPAGWATAEPAGVSPDGHYIVGSAYRNQNPSAVLWHDGVPRLLPLPRNVRYASAEDVNAAGQAVGELINGANETIFRYESGATHPLTMPPGGPWQHLGWPRIDAAGDIVANLIVDPNEPATVTFWPAGSTTPQVLPLPPGAEVSDLTDDGRLAGTLRSTDGTQAVVWDRAGNAVLLSAPAGMDADAQAAAGDWVGGRLWQHGYQPPSGQLPDRDKVYGVLWNLRTGERISLPQLASAGGVNRDGMAITFGQPSLHRDLVAAAVGTTYTLPKPGAEANMFVTGISDTRLVVGYGWNDSGTATIYYTAVWQC